MSLITDQVVDIFNLAEHLDDPDWAIVDCRFDLMDAAAGEKAYLASHIPGAVYVHLDRDLSGPKSPTGAGGRHPLPSPEHMIRIFGRLGIDAGTQVVAYDDTSGHYAARLWWMLRFMGHRGVALLDGGWPAWRDAGLPVASGSQYRPWRLFEGSPRWDRVALRQEVPAAQLLVDGRAPERYRGEVEPIDPVAGHIPGAINRPYAANWTGTGNWRSPEELLGEFLELINDTPAEDSVFYCGSGVSACVNLAAMVRAGLPEGRLYVGSWSEWSRLGGESDPPSF